MVEVLNGAQIFQENAGGKVKTEKCPTIHFQQFFARHSFGHIGCRGEVKVVPIHSSELATLQQRAIAYGSRKGEKGKKSRAIKIISFISDEF